MNDYFKKIKAHFSGAKYDDYIKELSFTYGDSANVFVYEDDPALEWEYVLVVTYNDNRFPTTASLTFDPRDMEDMERMEEVIEKMYISCVGMSDFAASKRTSDW